MYACIIRETFVFTVFRRVFHSILKLELSSNESVLSTIISFQIYIQKNAILEKNFEEIFAALPLAQISSKFFH